MKKVYISYPMNSEKHKLNQIQEQIMVRNAYPCLPPPSQLENRVTGATFDRYAIERSDEVWAFGKLGRDCAWELGFAIGLGKPTFIFVDKDNEHLIHEDWMLFIGATIIDLRDDK